MAQEKNNNSGLSNFITKLQDIWGKVDMLVLYIGALMLVVCVSSIVYGMFSREVLGKAAAWTYELGGYAIVYCTFACMPYLLWKKGHVIIDLFLGKMSHTQKRIHSVIILVVSMVCSAFMVWFGTGMVVNYFANNIVMMSTVPWPRGFLYLPIPVTFFVSLVQMFISLLEVIFQNDTIFPEDEIPTAPGQ